MALQGLAALDTLRQKQHIDTIFAYLFSVITWLVFYTRLVDGSL